MLRLFLLAAVVLGSCAGVSADGNSLQYLSENNPWYPHTGFPKLTTPQWVGEEGVDAVVVLAIDDMRDTAKYEEYLRPILQRLKQIDGRAPVSIMTCNVKPDDPQLQTWLDEGLSIEVHTVDHPCPILQGSDLAKAKSTYDRCVDLLGQIPRNKPVAFRTPCCDSLNTVSPRFFSEIFNQTTEQGNYLILSSSVFSMYTSADPEIPKELVTDADGQEKFRKYIPKGMKRNSIAQDNFVNWIENYPYPYVINGLCWEFPCMVPSDWEAQFLQQPNNPKTVEDMKTALDITVLKKGVFNLVFHPHGWIKAEQVVELIDHTVTKHGKKVKFLTFREAHDRLNENLLAGQPLRKDDGSDNGVRLLDVNRDGFMDVVIGTAARRLTRLWRPLSQTWAESNFPVRIGKGTHFTRVRNDGSVSILSETLEGPGRNLQKNSGTDSERAWHFDGHEWRADEFLQGLVRSSTHTRLTPIERNNRSALERPLATRAWRFVDVDHDGYSEAIVTWMTVNDDGSLDLPGRGDVNLFRPETVKQSKEESPDEALIHKWRRLRFAWPAGSLTPSAGVAPAQFRFHDLDGDGHDDLIASTLSGTTVALFDDFEHGWAKPIVNVERSSDRSFPVTIREDGSDNGFFFHSGHLCWQNELTADLPDMMHRVSIEKLLRPLKIEQGAVSPLKQSESDATANVNADAFPLSKTPEESLAAMQLAPGLKVELVAVEPLIQDPVAFEWDVQGRLWVVQMGGYPNGATDENGKPTSGGEIRVLEDVDHDGKYDKATVFLDGLNFPTGIHRWRNGVIVTDAPTIFYAEDTDGDLKADVRKTLYDGFVEGNQQHRVNGLSWGLDNWLHVANGDSGGEVRVVDKVGDEPLFDDESKFRLVDRDPFDPVHEAIGPGRSVNIRGRDVRIQPDFGLIDPVSGQSQFGRCRDDWGNWFGGNNSRPMWHYTLDDRYIRRNPHAAAGDSRREIFDPPGASPVFPISQTLERFNDHDRANRFTSACSVMIYRDSLLGEEFAGDAFVCEPVHNLVSRRIISEKDGVFTARRSASEKSSEFLASSDSWFRPVMIRTGPDGALWVADMYRFVIEHPEWIPPEWQQKLNLRAGQNMGRIYRIVRDENTACCGVVGSDAGQTSTDSVKGLRHWFSTKWNEVAPTELFERLSSRNGWWRDAVQRILVHRSREEFDRSALRKLMIESPSPATRLQALCTLAAFGESVRFSAAETALKDEHPAVRRHAVRLLTASLSPDFGGDKLATWSRFRVEMQKELTVEDRLLQIQLAYSCGESASPIDARLLAALAMEAEKDEQLMAAVFSSLHKANIEDVLMSVAARSKGSHPRLVTKLVGQAVALEQLRAVSEQVGNRFVEVRDGLPAGSLEPVTELLVEIRKTNGAWERLQESDSWGQIAKSRIAEAKNRALALLGDSSRDDAERVDALRFLSACGVIEGKVVPWINEALHAQNSPEIQAAVISALGQSSDSRVPELMLSRWAILTPTVRVEIVNTLLGSSDWTQQLLDSIETGQLATNQLDAAQRERLVTHRDVRIRERSAKLFDVEASSDRQSLIEDFEPALKLAGDEVRGRLIFEKRCASCHRLRGIGKSIGADLAALKDRTSKAILTAILDPNRAVEAKFLSYTAVTTAGKSVSGMLLSETGNSVTLVSTDGKEHVLLRRDLDQLISSQRSVMPEGLEKDLSQQDIADVIAFVQSSGLTPKKLPFNTPTDLSPSDDGVVRLPASAASVFGPSLIVEEHFRNLGQWLSAEDHAAWTIVLPESNNERSFDVEFDFACHKSAAGNQLVLSVAGQTLEGRVPSTDRWDRYSTWKPGTITLPPGSSRLVVFTRSPPVQALIDLREIRLVPRND
ncbi:MAG: c-type cytochrome [Planctomycetota bacterium]|nr:c-type cytochrome [Planctomycetota bacterium]